MKENKINFIFFGTPDFSYKVLETLKTNGFLPSLIVTSEDKPRGRKLILTPPPTKVWALENDIRFIQPKKLDKDLANELNKEKYDLSVIASYGKIIPQSVLNIPSKGNLNIHPSLLPRWRGASPIQSAILKDTKTGVTIILLDEEVDHGPIVAQKEISVDWPPYADELEEILAIEGANLLSETIEPWINGEIEAVPQDHSNATFCGKIEKSEGYIDLSKNPEENFLKIRAFRKNPGAYTIIDSPKKEKEIRVKILEALLLDGELKITKVIPEGKNEMSWQDFERGFLN